ncbi:hypothetical protein ScPMuIL_008537 [Solemya velum]
MFPTPNTSHLTSESFNDIYEPAEDTFLLLDTLETEHNNLKALRPSVCLEIGCGSGICITFLAQLLGPDSLYLCTDINAKAVDAARATAEANGVLVEPILTDLTACLEHRLKSKVDVLIFNPPYVVTPSDEVGSHGIAASWAGGMRGREVIDRLIPRIPDLLSDSGVFFLVIIKENNQDELEQMMTKHGFRMSVVLSRRSGPEFLSVLKFCRLRS